MKKSWKKWQNLELYEFVGEIDTCIATASFRRSLPVYCVPEFSEDKLSVTELYHPFLEEPVPNSLDFQKNIIVTGSNASGKSTFLKAVVLNVILGQSLYTCTASRMVIPDARVLTSMAVRDDILSGESYYMKEIRYLQRMVDLAGQGRMVVCGIDEVLRGTNTRERVAASIALLNYLCHEKCIVMVASHDLELAEALKDKYENYYFCEKVENGDVIFDYKLKKGIGNSFNAIRLLKAVGFPEEIVEEAGGLTHLYSDKMI